MARHHVGQAQGLSTGRTDRRESHSWKAHLIRVLDAVRSMRRADRAGDGVCRFSPPLKPGAFAAPDESLGVNPPATKGPRPGG